jgi:2-aminoadipate transaminase
LPEARARGVAQIELEPDVTDLGPGQPDPSLLPAVMYRSAMDRALRRHRADALGYGANAGPLPARKALAHWSAEIEQADCGAENVFVTAGATHALDLVCSRLGSHGAVVLVQRTTYPLALDLFRARGLEPVPVGADLAVPAHEDFTGAVRSLRAGGRVIAFAYLQPTFHNPTGISFSADDRRKLIAAARSCGVMLVEDDPYRLLHFRSPPLPSLVSLSRCQGVVGVRTLSKTLGPGARTGFLLADDRWLRDLGDDPLFTSGGGIAHVAALAITEMIGSGDFADHLRRLRGEYQQRCESLLGALAPLASAGVRWDQPEGGFFAWLKLPDGLPASRVHDAALKRGVRVLPGLGCFAAAPAEDDSWIRAAFSLYPAKVLAAAGERLVAAALETLGTNDEH